MACMDMLRNLSREQKLVFLALFGGYFAMVAPPVLISPFFPAEGEKYEVTAILIGIMYSVREAVSVVFGPLIGMAIAAFGPKICFITGVGTNAIFSIFLGLLQYSPSRLWFIVGSFVCLIMTNLGGSVIFTTALTYAVKLFPENLNLTIGTMELYISIAEFVALALGGFLHGLGGFMLPFVVFGVIEILSIFLHMYLLPSDEEPDISTSENPEVDQELPKSKKVENTEYVTPQENNIKPWHLLKIPGAMLISMCVLTTDICWAFMDSTLERHLAPLKLSSNQTAAMFQITVVAYGLSSPVWGFIADKMQRPWKLMVSCLVVGGATFYFLGPLPIFGLGNTVWLNAICLAVIRTCLAGVNVPATEACLLHTIEAGHQDGLATYAIVSSMISTCFNIGAVIGNFAAGFLVEGIGYAYTSAVYGTLMIVYGIIIVMYFLLCHKPKRKLTRRDLTSRKSSRWSLRLQALSSSLDHDSEVLSPDLSEEIMKMGVDNRNINIPLTSVVADNNILKLDSRKDV